MGCVGHPLECHDSRKAILVWFLSSLSFRPPNLHAPLSVAQISLRPHVFLMGLWLMPCCDCCITAHILPPPLFPTSSLSLPSSCYRCSRGEELWNRTCPVTLVRSSSLCYTCVSTPPTPLMPAVSRRVSKAVRRSILCGMRMFAVRVLFDIGNALCLSVNR